jgi:hypothetical protein
MYQVYLGEPSTRVLVQNASNQISLYLQKHNLRRIAGGALDLGNIHFNIFMFWESLFECFIVYKKMSLLILFGYHDTYMQWSGMLLLFPRIQMKNKPKEVK